MKRKRYVVVGVGGRGTGMFVRPLAKRFPMTAELAAVCDSNAVRLAYCNATLPRPVPAYTDFDRMLHEVKPDAVVVATRDCTHEPFVLAGLAAGKRVYSEKPLCTTVAQCRAILAAAKRSRGECFVTHNLRYLPAMGRIRDIIRAGTLGRVSHMRFDETLDRGHGADYFRRWHRQIDNSGGLLIHKASHHFDILNWWADAKPATVQARGRLAFYGRNGGFRGKRCLGCAHARECSFHIDFFKRKEYRKMYQEAECEDGYLRDGCVFDRNIDICDQMDVLVQYQNDIQVSYTLNAFSPYESMRCVIEGTGGRLEYEWTFPARLSGVEWMPQLAEQTTETLRLYAAGMPVKQVKLPRQKGAHGGADELLGAEFFGDWSKKPSDRMATLDAAAQAVLIGAAANRSIATGRSVDVQELLHDKEETP